MRLPATVVAILTLSLAGCEGAFPEFLAKHHELWAERERMKAAVRASEQRARREERNSEMEARIAHSHADCQNSRRQVEQVVHSELGLGLDQRVRIGQLQVDGEKLKQLLAQRDKELQEANKLYEEIDKQYHDLKKRGLEEEARRYLDAVRDAQSGHDGKCCPEKTCGIPPFEARRPPELPAQRPLLPTEIPLMLPVTLEVQLENARVRESEVRSVPTYVPCDKCKHCPCTCGCLHGLFGSSSGSSCDSVCRDPRTTKSSAPTSSSQAPPNPPPPLTENEINSSSAKPGQSNPAEEPNKLRVVPTNKPNVDGATTTAPAQSEKPAVTAPVNSTSSESCPSATMDAYPRVLPCAAVSANETGIVQRTVWDFQPFQALERPITDVRFGSLKESAVQN
jgi:hypothetical protein